MVQAAHAAHESGIWLADRSPDTNSIIVLQCKDEPSLIHTYESLSKDIDLVMFREPDIGNQATAFASKPISGDHRKLFKKFKLWSQP